MARRAKSPKGKAKKAKRPLALKPPKDEVTRVRDLERRLAEALEQRQTRHDELAEALKREARALRREAEALEQQTATAEILRVISSSPTDVRPVFDVIARNAVGLCDGYFSLVGVSDGERVHLRATHNLPDEWAKVARTVYPLPLSSGPGTAQVIREQRVVHILDSQEDPAVSALGRERARLAGYHTWLGVPMLGPSGGIGVIAVARREKVAFTDKQIALLQTFADQAVIAIENVRLFNETKEALDRQTATSEILKVISSSRTDVRPVFSAILGNALRLCDGLYGAIFMVRNRDIHLEATANINDEAMNVFHAVFPIAVDSEGTVPQVIREGVVVHLPDILHDARAATYARRLAEATGYRCALFIPFIRDDKTIGALALTRAEPRPFSATQIALVRAFADQAVIAIENVRLFTELQASNPELTTALDTQTATSDILRVISRSQTDVQPVFDAIMNSAVRLLRAYSGALTRIEGDQLELAAHMSFNEAAAVALRALFPRSLQSEGPAAQTIRDRAPVNIADQQTDPQVPEPVRAMARASGHRSVVWVPLLHHDEAVGGIGVTRRDPGGFTDDEIALLQTFADQAVIAIENVRLFTELQQKNSALTEAHAQVSEALEQQTATSEILRVISSSPTDVQPVFDTIVASATRLCSGLFSAVYRYDGELIHLVAHHNFSPTALAAARRTFPMPPSQGGATARAVLTREVVHIPDLRLDPEYAHQTLARDVGFPSLLAVPMLREGMPIGAITVAGAEAAPFSDKQISLLQTFADQAVIAIENVRLFKELQERNREVEQKSRELAAASQHKSEFLANMSHELRTPLNAIIGYSELLEEEAGDLDGGRLVPDLQKIATAAKHQLSLINDILDLSKIEAGRMELELADFHLPSAVENALILVRERASRRGIALGHMIDSGLGMVRADERKVKQVLLNLLSNALKFTPEGGRVDVRAGVRDDFAEISVADTGVGIAPEDQEAVFEEFRQVGTAAKKVEGTGLGLALSRKFVELHGGRISVTSQVGHGSTFTFTLPVRSEKEMGA